MSTTTTNGIWTVTAKKISKQADQAAAF
ncbi:hypothetical protein CABS03_14314 [Colletotrichum abscissum]